MHAIVTERQRALETSWAYECGYSSFNFGHLAHQPMDQQISNGEPAKHLSCFRLLEGGAVRSRRFLKCGNVWDLRLSR